MTTAADKKRKARDGSISPPPTRLKVQSNTTKSAVSSFFTPLSQKLIEPTTKVIWQERAASDDVAPTLLVGKYDTHKGGSSKPPTKRRKIAAFDFDSTLVRTISSKTFNQGPSDWTWWHMSVPEKLRKLYTEDGYQVVILSNQAGLAFKSDSKKKKPDPKKANRLSVFKTKVSAALSQLGIAEITLYAATEYDIFRKPRPGMWKEMIEDYDLDDAEGVDLENSFFVGDAAGRIATQGKPKDFGCSDRDLAQNIGIKFLTPEEYFLGEPARPFERDLDPEKLVGEGVPAVEDLSPKFSKVNKQDIVLSVGSPGAGKSTFYWKTLKPLGYERVNQDILKTREKCLKVAQELLSKGKSVAVDNTNADEAVRLFWTALASKNNVPIRCVVFKTTSRICEHNDAVRALNPSMNPEHRTILPKLAFNGFNSRFRMPTLAEGFQDITELDFKFDGNTEEREIWCKHWT